MSVNMKIHSVEPKYQYPSKKETFKGIPCAKAGIKSLPDYGEIVLYRLEKKDIPFLTQMLRNIRLEKLAPDVKNSTELGEWKHLIKKAVEGVKNEEDVYLSTYKNRPCGIMSQTEHFDDELLYVSYTASWPYKTGESVKCAGKVLFKNIFEQAKNLKKGVCLVLSKKAPKGKRENKEFYKKLKFQFLNDSRRDLKIVDNKDVPKVLKSELDSALSFQKLPEDKSVNLSKVLDINYDC